MSSHHNGNSGRPGTLFGLQCTCQPMALYKNPSTAKGPALKNLFQKQNRGVGITKTYTINIFIHFLTTESPKILLRGCSCLCSSHPRSPWPRGAARPRNRGLRRLPNAAVFCLRSRGPRPSRRQNPTERTEKNYETILMPQESKFWKLWPLNFLPGLNEHCGFEMSWSHRVGWKSHVNHGGSPNDLVPSFPFQFAWAR